MPFKKLILQGKDYPEHLAWLLWVLLIIIISITKSLKPINHTQVFFIYADAASRWLTARALYDGSGTGFIYFPQSAMLFIPFTNLSPLWASLIWRAINILVFAIGVQQLTRLIPDHSSTSIPTSKPHRLSLFLPVSLVSILLSWSAARYGQVTLIMIGLMMIAIARLHHRHWNQAALWLTLALAFKPLALVMILLAMVFYRHIRLPLLIAILCSLILPFLFQGHDYVLTQYLGCFNELKQASHFGVDHPYAQLFWMLNTLDIKIPSQWHNTLRILFAMATLALGWRLRKRQTSNAFIINLFFLGVLYLLLFNPRTENNTYAMIGPILGLLTVLHRRWSCLFWYRAHVTLIVLFLLSHPIGKILTGSHVIWIKPALTVAITMLYFLSLRRHRWIHTLNHPSVGGNKAIPIRNLTGPPG